MGNGGAIGHANMSGMLYALVERAASGHVFVVPACARVEVIQLGRWHAFGEAIEPGHLRRKGGRA